MSNKSIEDIKPVAFEFAKAIVANNPNVKADELMKKSVEHALTWLDSDDLIQKTLNKHYPDWVLLSEADDKLKASLQDPTKKYWIAGELETSRELVVRIAIYIPTPNVHESKNIYADNNGNLINAFYVLNSDDSEEFDVKNPPNVPLNMKSAFLAQGLNRMNKSMRMY